MLGDLSRQILNWWWWRKRERERAREGGRERASDVSMLLHNPEKNTKITSIVEINRSTASDLRYLKLEDLNKFWQISMNNEQWHRVDIEVPHPVNTSWYSIIMELIGHGTCWIRFSQVNWSHDSFVGPTLRPTRCASKTLEAWRMPNAPSTKRWSCPYWCLSSLWAYATCSTSWFSSVFFGFPNSDISWANSNQ